MRIAGNGTCLGKWALGTHHVSSDFLGANFVDPSNDCITATPVNTAMRAFDLAQVKLKKTTTVDHSAPKIKGMELATLSLISADVEELSANHDQVFMSFNIEHWYPLLGPMRTAETSLLPIAQPVALELCFLNKMMKTEKWTRETISEYVHHSDHLSATGNELDALIPSGGAFLKTSARSCKDTALQIGLKDCYRQILSQEIESSAQEIDEMRSRILFMEAARQVLRFTSATDFLVACAMSDRVCGVATKLRTILIFRTSNERSKMT